MYRLTDLQVEAHPNGISSHQYFTVVLTVIKDFSLLYPCCCTERQPGYLASLPKPQLKENSTRQKFSAISNRCFTS